MIKNVVNVTVIANTVFTANVIYDIYGIWQTPLSKVIYKSAINLKHNSIFNSYSLGEKKRHDKYIKNGRM